MYPNIICILIDTDLFCELSFIYPVMNELTFQSAIWIFNIRYEIAKSAKGFFIHMQKIIFKEHFFPLIFHQILEIINSSVRYVWLFISIQKFYSMKILDLLEYILYPWFISCHFLFPDSHRDSLQLNYQYYNANSRQSFRSLNIMTNTIKKLPVSVQVPRSRRAFQQFLIQQFGDGRTSVFIEQYRICHARRHHDNCF